MFESLRLTPTKRNQIAAVDWFASVNSGELVFRRVDGSRLRVPVAINPSEGEGLGLPPGGDIGQTIIKSGAEDGEAEWGDFPEGTPGSAPASWTMDDDGEGTHHLVVGQFSGTDGIAEVIVAPDSWAVHISSPDIPARLDATADVDNVTFGLTAPAGQTSDILTLTDDDSGAAILRILADGTLGIKSPDNTWYKLTVDNAGVLAAVAV